MTYENCEYCEHRFDAKGEELCRSEEYKDLNTAQEEYMIESGMESIRGDLE